VLRVRRRALVVHQAGLGVEVERHRLLHGARDRHEEKAEEDLWGRGAEPPGVGFQGYRESTERKACASRGA
jgi:hypothetical protein